MTTRAFTLVQDTLESPEASMLVFREKASPTAFTTFPVELRFTSRSEDKGRLLCWILSLIFVLFLMFFSWPYQLQCNNDVNTSKGTHSTLTRYTVPFRGQSQRKIQLSDLLSLVLVSFFKGNFKERHKCWLMPFNKYRASTLTFPDVSMWPFVSIRFSFKKYFLQRHGVSQTQTWLFVTKSSLVARGEIAEGYSTEQRAEGNVNHLDLV